VGSLSKGDHTLVQGLFSVTEASAYLHVHEWCPPIICLCPTSLVSPDGIACVGKQELTEWEKRGLELPAR